MSFDLAGFDLATFIRGTLAEDLGEGLPGGGRDVTSESVIPADARFTGVMDSRDAIVVAGLPLAAAFFRHLDPVCTIEPLVDVGDKVSAGTDLLRIAGQARARGMVLVTNNTREFERVPGLRVENWMTA